MRERSGRKESRLLGLLYKARQRQPTLPRHRKLYTQRNPRPALELSRAEPELSYRRRRSATHEESRRRASRTEAPKLQVRRFFLAERETEEGSPGVSSRSAGMRMDGRGEYRGESGGVPRQERQLRCSTAKRRGCAQGAPPPLPPKDLVPVQRERGGGGAAREPLCHWPE